LKKGGETLEVKGKKSPLTFLHKRNFLTFIMNTFTRTGESSGFRSWWNRTSRCHI